MKLLSNACRNCFTLMTMHRWSSLENAYRMKTDCFIRWICVLLHSVNEILEISWINISLAYAQATISFLLTPACGISHSLSIATALASRSKNGRQLRDPNSLYLFSIDFDSLSKVTRKGKCQFLRSVHHETCFEPRKCMALGAVGYSCNTAHQGQNFAKTLLPQLVKFSFRLIHL